MRITDIDKDLPILNRFLSQLERQEELRKRKEQKYDTSAVRLEKAVDEKGNLVFKNLQRALPTTFGPYTTSTTYVTVPEMEIKVVLNSGNALLLAQVPVVFINGSGNMQARVRIVRDGATLVGPESLYETTTLNLDNTLPVGGMDVNIAPGAHTYTLQWRIASGDSPTLASNETNRQMLLIELG